MEIALVIALILTVVHSFSRKIAKVVKNHHININSFSAGMFITLIFIDFLPRVTLGLNYNVPVFLILTLGFILYHLSEKYLYQHVKNKKELIKDLAEMHNFGFFVNHLMVGFMLYLALGGSELTSYIILVPFILHTLSSSMSLDEIHRRIKTKANKFLLNCSTFLGALFAFFVKLETFWYYAFFAFFLGSLLYIAIRDMLPGGKKGNVFMFFLGFLATVSIFMLIP